MDAHAVESQLRAEGFAHTYVWQDGPHAHYSDHTHPVVTAHVVLEGEIAVTMNGETHTYGVGERFDVPAGAVHSAKMGPRGCRYVIGEK